MREVANDTGARGQTSRLQFSTDINYHPPADLAQSSQHWQEYQGSYQLSNCALL